MELYHTHRNRYARPFPVCKAQHRAAPFWRHFDQFRREPKNRHVQQETRQFVRHKLDDSIAQTRCFPQRKLVASSLSAMDQRFAHRKLVDLFIHSSVESLVHSTINFTPNYLVTQTLQNPSPTPTTTLSHPHQRHTHLPAIVCYAEPSSA